MKRLITLFALLTMFAIGAQAQIVGANEGPKTSTNTTSSLCKPTGHYLRFEVGYPQIVSIAYSYQMNPFIMFGAGCGYGIVSYYYSNQHSIPPEKGKIGGSGLPLYVEAIFSTPKYNYSLIADIKMGYAIPFDEYNYSIYDLYSELKGNRLWGALHLGVSYKNFCLCVGISSNNPDFYYLSTFVSYNLPLRIH